MHPEPMSASFRNQVSTNFRVLAWMHSDSNWKYTMNPCQSTPYSHVEDAFRIHSIMHKWWIGNPFHNDFGIHARIHSQAMPGCIRSSCQNAFRGHVRMCIAMRPECMSECSLECMPECTQNLCEHAHRIQDRVRSWSMSKCFLCFTICFGGY